MNMEAGKSISLNVLLKRWERMVSETALPQPPYFDGPDTELTDIIEHTDYVKSGSCFVARVRTGTDGHPYISKAIHAGASLIIGQRSLDDLGVELGDVPYIQVEDSAAAEAWLAAAMYDFPSRKLVMIGVTGTDGKTTTTNLIYEVLRSSGIEAGMLSTIKASIGSHDEPLALHVTTPEAPIIQGYLQKMVDAGLTHCVLEVTSHSLAQHRVDAIEFDVAVHTNITHEHLDYHGDYERYFNAKARLFSGLNGPFWHGEYNAEEKSALEKTAILNRDDQSFESLAQIAPAKQITYGINQAADISAAEIIYAAEQTSFKLQLPQIEGSTRIDTTLVGEFNVSNLLAAAGAALTVGISPEAIYTGLSGAQELSGRMEKIAQGQDFHVIVDFAHTPNGLERAIGAARSMTGGRIITVFGSAGKRDVAKRIIMAEVSARDADLSILTAEDPRTESLDEILSMMADGCIKQGALEGKDFWRVKDRGAAIYFALSLAASEDLVLICGKGHEQSMCFGTTEFPWDDRQATRAAIDSLLEGKPMVDLGLPTFENSS
jgi:UDP-N-acetylmuramoyl-L-alanyl-D-glutamate--2,6-diaminopimelate ligase